MPPFYVKNKELVFPKLNKEQSIDMIKQMQKGQQLMMEGDKENKETPTVFKDRGDRDSNSRPPNYLPTMKKNQSKEMFNINGVLK